MLGEGPVWTVIVRSWFVIWTCDNAIQGVKLLKKPWRGSRNLGLKIWLTRFETLTCHSQAKENNVTPQLVYKTGSQRIESWEAASNANALISLGYRISVEIKVCWRELFNASPDNSTRTGSLQKHLVVFCEACLCCQGNYCMAEWTNCVALTKTNRIVRVKCCVPRSRHCLDNVIVLSRHVFDVLL